MSDALPETALVAIAARGPWDTESVRSFAHQMRDELSIDQVGRLLDVAWSNAANPYTLVDSLKAFRVCGIEVAL